MTKSIKKSSPVDVISSVLQGTVLAPLLFLCFVNDLPSVVTVDVISSVPHSVFDKVLWRTKWRMKMLCGPVP